MFSKAYTILSEVHYFIIFVILTAGFNPLHYERRGTLDYDSIQGVKTALSKFGVTLTAGFNPLNFEL